MHYASSTYVQTIHTIRFIHVTKRRPTLEWLPSNYVHWTDRMDWKTVRKGGRIGNVAHRRPTVFLDAH